VSRGARLVAPLLAVAVFAFVTAQTLAALQESGVWSFASRRTFTATPEPFVSLDGIIAKVQAAKFAGAVRDPFGYGATRPSVSVSRPVVRRPVRPAPPPVPVLTAIIYDADPRAIIHWKGRDYAVHRNELFDEFVVVSIGRDQVVLRRGSENIVLRRQPQGE